MAGGAAEDMGEARGPKDRTAQPEARRQPRKEKAEGERPRLGERQQRGITRRRPARAQKVRGDATASQGKYQSGSLRRRRAKTGLCW